MKTLSADYPVWLCDIWGVVHNGLKGNEAAAHALQHELTVPEYSTHLFKPHAWGTMADSETFAHLEYLHQQGKATARNVGGKLLYRITGD